MNTALITLELLAEGKGPRYANFSQEEAKQILGMIRSELTLHFINGRESKVAIDRIKEIIAVGPHIIVDIGNERLACIKVTR